MQARLQSGFFSAEEQISWNLELQAMCWLEMSLNRLSDRVWYSAYRKKARVNWSGIGKMVAVDGELAVSGWRLAVGSFQ